MHRSAVLGALLLVSACSAFQHFSKKTSPCENFYDFVCNPEENGPNDLAVNNLKRFLYDDMLKFLVANDTDFALEHVVMENVNAKMNDFYSEQGEKLGIAVAQGLYKSRNLRIYEDYLSNEIEITFEKGDHEISCEFSECHSYYQGMARGFIKVIDLFDTMDVTTTHIKVRMSQSDLPDLPEESKDWKKNIYGSLLNDMSGQFHSHMNMLIGGYFFNQGNFSQTLIDNLHKMYENIVIELKPSLENSPKLDEYEKNTLLKSLEVITPEFGFPEVFKRPDLLRDYLKITDMTVKRGVESAAYKSKTSIDRVSALAQMLQLAAKRFRAQHPTVVDDYLWTKDDKKLPEHISALKFGSSVWFQKVSLFFYPSLIQAMNYPEPIGFKYGLLGSVIAEDILAFLEGVAQGAFTRKEQSCEKIFTDADVARVVYKVLQKARKELYSYSLQRHRRFSESTFNDREYFFIGMASRFCTSERPLTAEEEQKMGVPGLIEVEDKAANMKRVNRLVKEMHQFATLFQCSPDFIQPSECGFVPDQETQSLWYDQVGGSGEELNTNIPEIQSDEEGYIVPAPTY